MFATRLIVATYRPPPSFSSITARLEHAAAYWYGVPLESAGLYLRTLVQTGVEQGTLPPGNIFTHGAFLLNAYTLVGSSNRPEHMLQVLWCTAHRVSWYITETDYQQSLFHGLCLCDWIRYATRSGGDA